MSASAHIEINTLDAVAEDTQTLPVAEQADATPFFVHVQFKPRWSAVTKFAATLSRVVGQAVDVPVLVSGASRDDQHLNITVAVSLGPEHLIPTFSPQATAGYSLCESFFNELMDYTPLYVADPTPEETAAAHALAEHLGLASLAATTAARAA